MPQKKTVLLFGNYGGQNRGDEAILSGLLHCFPKDHFRLLVFSSDPQKTKKIHQVESIPFPPFGLRSLFRSSSYSFLSPLREASIVLFGGGGLFQDREPFAVLLWSYFALLVRFVSKRNTKVFCVGNSFGPFRSLLSKFFVRIALQNIRFFSVRDSESLALLHRLAPQNALIEQATDFAFALSTPRTRYKRQGTILAFRGDGNISLERVQKMFNFLPKPITAIAMDSVDQTFAKRLHIPLLEPKNTAELLRFFSEAECVLSSRLHGGILSLLAETPFLLFSSAPKIQHFFGDRGLSKLVLREDSSLEEIRKAGKKILSSSEKWQKEFRCLRKEERQKTKLLFPAFLQK